MLAILKIIKKNLNNFRKDLMSQEQYQNYLRRKGVKIGVGCSIEKSAVFGSEPWLITIGDNVRITKDVQFITHDGGLWTLRKLNMIDKSAVKYGRIVIEDNCNISWNAVIMPNVTVGKNSVVAVGAVVTKNVEPNSIVGGVPAKKIETINEYCEKIADKCCPTYYMSNMEKKNYLMINNLELFD